MATRWRSMALFALGACTNNPAPPARATAPTVAAPRPVAVDAPAVAIDAGAPARCVSPTWRRRAQHVAVDEGGGGALVVFLCVDRAERECTHYEASPGNTTATPVEYGRNRSQWSRFTGRPGRSRYELHRDEGGPRVCRNDNDSCVETSLPAAEGLESAAVTDDGRYVVYQPAGVTQVAVFPVAPGDERRIDMNLAWVDATLLGTALVATFCDDYVSRVACRAEVRALPSGRRVATVARHGADVQAVVRVSDDRWAVVDAAAGTWVMLRGDGSVDGPPRAVVDAAAVRAGRALLYPQREGGYALIARDPGDADFGAVRWFTWEGAAAESTTRVPWCSQVVSAFREPSRRGEARASVMRRGEDGTVARRDSTTARRRSSRPATGAHCGHTREATTAPHPARSHRRAARDRKWLTGVRALRPRHNDR